jgi:multicomponent Na+:H+ antiporter subunit E
MTSTSPDTPAERRSSPHAGPQSAPPRRRPLKPLVLLWLAVVWVALWGDVSVGNVLSGLVVGAVVSLVFPLPPLRMNLHVRPLWLGWLIVHFLWDVVVASYQVAVKTLDFRRQPRNAVIEVDLRTESDFVLTVVAEMVSLVPGSLVVEARAATHTIFLHVLDVGDVAGAEAFRKQVFELERRVVLALGADTTAVDHPRVPPEQGATT